MFHNAGFDGVEEIEIYMTPFGTLSLYRERKAL